MIEDFNSEIFFIDNTMWWSREDIDCYYYLKESHKMEMEIIIPFLRDRSVAVQAGAHCGYVIKELKEHFDTIYCFEPNNSMFLAMCMNITDKNVFKFQACLGDEHKLVNMVPNGSFGAGANFVSGVGKIPMLRIDDLNLNQCDLLMIDTEGYEYPALIGGLETINKFKPLICIERFWGPRTVGVSELQMDEFLKSLGYKEVACAGESDHIFQYIQ